MARYAMSDLHGNGKLFAQMLEVISPTDEVFALGDVIDRGPDGYEMMKTILADDRFTYIKGNHEDLFVKAIEEYHDTRGGRWGSIQLHFQNGGEPTFSAWQDAGASLEVADILRKLPYKKDLINDKGLLIHLSHAGYSPNYIPFDQKDYLWDRYHFNTEWPKDSEYDNDVIIHGHTPMQYMNAKPENGSFFYDNGHKINLDCGTFNSGIAVLLDIDTFDEHIFS